MKKEDERYIQTLKPTVWIGKNGFSEEIAAELKNQLKSRGVVKVKWLSSVMMEEGEAEDLAKLVSAEVVGVRGKIAVLVAKNRPVQQNPESSVKRTAVSRRVEAHRRSILYK